MAGLPSTGYQQVELAGAGRILSGDPVFARMRTHQRQTTAASAAQGATFLNSYEGIY